MSDMPIEVHVCRVEFSEEKVIDKFCPTCKKTTQFLAEFEGWYGWRCTCLACGDIWADGELVERPFARGWRKERIRRAMERVKALPHKGTEDTEKQNIS